VAPRIAADPEAPAPFDPPVRPRWKRPQFDPVGVVSLLFAAGALLCASFAWWLYALSWLVMPLVGAGAVVGLACLVRGLRAVKPRYVLSGLGAGVCVGILFVALFFPSLLGPTYGVWRQASAPEPSRPTPVPLAHLPPGAVPDDPEWPDAGKFSIKFGKVRVQIVSAVIRPVEVASQPKKKLTKESYLVLRVRAYRPAGGEESALAGAATSPGSKETLRPRLTDVAGQVFAQAFVGSDAGETRQASHMFPIGISDQVYVFDPPPGVDLRLEIPAQTWGGSGNVRFAIPRQMIRTETDPTTAPKIEK
jgi:hypothetical protein